MKTILKNGLMFVALYFIATSCKEKTKAVIPPQNITVVEVIQKDVPIYNEMVGQIYGYKDIPIRARVEGFLEEISFDEGSRVEKDQLLYSIDPQPFEAKVASQRSKVAEAKTLLVNAKNELDRYKPLAEQNAVSKSDLDAAQANYDASIASVDAAKANLTMAEIELGYCRMRAPIVGIIGKTEARVGEFVGKDPNPVILNTVSRIDTVRVQFSISESKYIQIARAYSKSRTAKEVQEDVDESEVKANVELILSDGTIYEEKGKVDFVNNQIDANTGSLLVQASFPNESRLLRPGMYAKVRIELDEEKDALVIPQRCLIELQGSYSVYAVGEDNKIVSKPIVLGYRLGDMYVIESGLTKDDVIVIDAIQKVKVGSEIVPVMTEFKSKSDNK